MSVSNAFRRCICLFGLFAVLAFVIAAPRDARAQDENAGFLRVLPSAETVFAHFGDAADPDPVRPLARQCAALGVLERRFLEAFATRMPTVAAHPETQRVREDYRQGFALLGEQYADAVGRLDDEKRQIWSAVCANRFIAGMRFQPVSLDEVRTLVPTRLMSLLLTMEAEERRDARNRQRRGIGFGVLAFGAIMMVLAGSMGYRLGKYRFHNTTDGGVVQFEGFGAAIRHDLATKMSAWAFYIGGLVVIIGIIVVLSSISY